MTKIIINLFGYDQAQTVLTRTYVKRHWFMAADICRLLGIKGYSQAVHKNLADSEWKKETEFTGGSRRKLLMINERGLYKLIHATRDAKEIQERARRVTAPLRPASWPEERAVL
jgi:prophage antirepressor-like protein